MMTPAQKFEIALQEAIKNAPNPEVAKRLQVIADETVPPAPAPGL